MAVFPVGATIDLPTSTIAGFTCAGLGGGAVHFLPGFPIMAWPMAEQVLDTYYRHRSTTGAWQERSVIVFGAMEASLTPLMVRIEQTHPVKVFSLPSVDHPEYGRHIELGVKGAPAAVGPAFEDMRGVLSAQQIRLGLNWCARNCTKYVHCGTRIALVRRQWLTPVAPCAQGVGALRGFYLGANAGLSDPGRALHAP